MKIENSEREAFVAVAERVSERVRSRIAIGLATADAADALRAEPLR